MNVMDMRNLIKRLLSIIKRLVDSINSVVIPIYFKLRNKNKERFTCPVCNYRGPFIDIASSIIPRKNVTCPKCRSNERIRLQHLVINELSKTYDFSKMSILHIAPERIFRKYFKKRSRKYITADLSSKNVNINIDLRNLPFKMDSFDIIFASHVLEHIKDDYEAISEISRVIKPRGMAILPVPIIAHRTVEYPEPNPAECGHVRAPGADYYERYRKYFPEVKVYSSPDFPLEYQLLEYEDRKNFPAHDMPYRPKMDGDKHPDFVPVCFK